MDKLLAVNYEVIISETQLRQRIGELGRQISQDFEGRLVHCVGVLEDSFVFVADLLREITCDVRCQFVKPYVREIHDRNFATTEIFYAPEMDIEGQHVLLCVGVLSSGQTTDFLVRAYQARGAASISICTLLDRQADRRINLEVAYFGFQVGPQWLAGFGLGTPTLDRNRPFIFAATKLRG
jgi:hypoxanthine phosphoribosyltransferase